LQELAVDRLPRLRPLDEDVEVVAAPLERVDEIPFLLEAPAALQDLLGFGWVVPEIRRGRARLETA
jgi:hypothetical protein